MTDRPEQPSGPPADTPSDSSGPSHGPSEPAGEGSSASARAPRAEEGGASDPSADPTGGGSPAAEGAGSGAGSGDRSDSASANRADGSDGAPGGEDAEQPKRRRRRRRRRKPAAGQDGSADDAQGAATDEGAATDGGAADASDASGAADRGEEGDEGGKKRRRRRRKRKSDDGGQQPEGEPADGAASRRAEAKKKARKKKPGKGPVRHGHEHHALRAVKALSEMASQLLEVEGVDLFSRPRWMDVRLRVPLDAGRDGQTAASAVTEQILARVREVHEHERALAPGSVYSFYHERADAEGCRPANARQVFDGYSSTGKPQWADFVTQAIDRKDEGIDEMLEGADLVVTHVTMGRVLRTQQLAEFGKQSPVFRLLGQVDAGLFPVLRSDGKAAFSFQLLKGSTLEGKPRLRIHPVSAADLTDLADPSYAQILYKFQQRLDVESLRLAGLEANDSAPADEDFVLPLLQDLARQLAGRARRKSRRTDHATKRSDERQRPTTNAFSDAKTAADDCILCDDVQDTVVVVGAKGRIHVFTHDARHVTSLIMQNPAVQKRRSQGRWRLADPEERGTFRIGLSQRLGEQGEDEGNGNGGDGSA